MKAHSLFPVLPGFLSLQFSLIWTLVSLRPFLSVSACEPEATFAVSGPPAHSVAHSSPNSLLGRPALHSLCSFSLLSPSLTSFLSFLVHFASGLVLNHRMTMFGLWAYSTLPTWNHYLFLPWPFNRHDLKFMHKPCGIWAPCRRFPFYRDMNPDTIKMDYMIQTHFGHRTDTSK